MGRTGAAVNSQSPSKIQKCIPQISAMPQQMLAIKKAPATLRLHQP
jgi:hypothetical protein